MNQTDIVRELLLAEFNQIRARVVSADGTWTVKGFIDVYKNIYTISPDTKVLSKVLELLMFPVIARFAEEHEFRIELSKAQNKYPDVSLVSRRDPNELYAIDVKSTYRTKRDKAGDERVNGMTLGTYMGYFRTRDKPVSSTYAYARYRKHYVLGVIYDRVPKIDERKVFSIERLDDIPSVARNFNFFFHEKYKIASDAPGSGNTKNIGSTKHLDRLLQGTGVFADLGIEIFDDYWMNYRTSAMANSEGFEAVPYRNLIEYKQHKAQGIQILAIPDEKIVTEVEGDGTISESEDGDIDE